MRRRGTGPKPPEQARDPSRLAATAVPGKSAAGGEGPRKPNILLPVQDHPHASPWPASFPWLVAPGTRLGQHPKVVGQGLFFGKSREACGMTSRLGKGESPWAELRA